MGSATGTPVPSSKGADEAAAFAERVSTICSRVLGDGLASVVLHGSLVLGDYTRPWSDIDVLGIVARPLLDVETALLSDALIAAGAAAPAPVDLRLVTVAVAASRSYAPPVELYIRFGGTKPAVIEQRSPGEPDLTVEFSICRQHGWALRGAQPRTLIGEVPKHFVVAAGDCQLARWQSLTEDTASAGLMVLTACRIWRFGKEGRHSSKRAAGLWALERDPSLVIVRDALRQRAGHRVRVDPGEIGRLLRLVRQEIGVDAAARGATPGQGE